MVVLHLPATGKLQLLVGEHVEEGDKVSIVLVALKVMGVPSHLADHVLQAGVARKHAVGTLGRQQRVRSSDSDMHEGRFALVTEFIWYLLFSFYETNVAGKCAKCKNNK